MRDDITVLIQGPLNETSLSHIGEYSKYGKIVISSWSNTKALLQEYSSEINEKEVSVVMKPEPNRDETVGVQKTSTFYFAIASIYYGVSAVDTKYVIKTRSDEKYSNLECVINKFFERQPLIVCGNIFARSDIDLHFGDHFYFCRTDVLKAAVKNLKDMYDGVKSLEDWAIQRRGNAAEQILATALIKAYAEIEEKAIPDLPKFYNENFVVVDINSLQPFTARWQAGKKTYQNSFSDKNVTKGEKCGS